MSLHVKQTSPPLPPNATNSTEVVLSEAVVMMAPSAAQAKKQLLPGAERSGSWTRPQVFTVGASGSVKAHVMFVSVFSFALFCLFHVYLSNLLLIVHVA